MAMSAPHQHMEDSWETLVPIPWRPSLGLFTGCASAQRTLPFTIPANLSSPFEAPVDSADLCHPCRVCLGLGRTAPSVPRLRRLSLHGCLPAGHGFH